MHSVSAEDVHNITVDVKVEQHAFAKLKCFHELILRRKPKVDIAGGLLAAVYPAHILAGRRQRAPQVIQNFIEEQISFCMQSLGHPLLGVLKEERIVILKGTRII